MYDLKKYKILFVDDEIETLNAFETYFQNDFNLITAESAAKAEELLEKRGSEIAIVLSDHRMPKGGSGLELLKRCSEKWPYILCLLTTAYSDHKLALDAINSGVVYKYIVKPWNLEELKIALMHTMEFFLIRSERDMLLKEKVSILRTIITSDKKRALTVFTAGLLYHLRNAEQALNAFLSLTETNNDTDQDDQKVDKVNFWKTSTEKAKQDIKDFIKLAKTTGESVIAINDSFETGCNIADLIKEGTAEATKKDNEKRECKIQIDVSPKLQSLNEHCLNPVQIRALFKILVGYITKNCPDKSAFFKISEDVFKDKPCTSISISANSPLNILKNKDHWELLPVFFIVFHHDGYIDIDADKITIKLPFEIDKKFKSGSEHLLEMLENFEIIKHFEAWIDALFGAE